MSDIGRTESVRSTSDRSAKPRYARLPLEVLRNTELSWRARVVYAELSANIFQGSVARIGLRLIGQRLGCGRDAVARAIAELETAKLVTVERSVKSRSWYVLASPVFGQKQKAGAKEVVSCPRGHKQMVSVPREEIA